MSTTTAIQPANPDTHAPSLTPGITAAEADLITAAARRFLDATPGFHEITMAAITYQIGTLFAPYERPFTEPYICKKSDHNTHYCSIG